MRGEFNIWFPCFLNRSANDFLWHLIFFFFSCGKWRSRTEKLFNTVLDDSSRAVWYTPLFYRSPFPARRSPASYQQTQPVLAISAWGKWSWAMLSAEKSISFAIWQELVLPGQESASLHGHKDICHFLAMSLGQPSLGTEALSQKKKGT